MAMTGVALAKRRSDKSTDARTDVETRGGSSLSRPRCRRRRTIRVRFNFFIVVCHNRMSNPGCAVHRRGRKGGGRERRRGPTRAMSLALEVQNRFLFPSIRKVASGCHYDLQAINISATRSWQSVPVIGISPPRRTPSDGRGRTRGRKEGVELGTCQCQAVSAIEIRDNDSDADLR